MIGRAAFAAVDIVACRFRCHTHRGVAAAHAPIHPAGLIEAAAEQADRSEAGLRFGKAEGVRRADAVDTLLGVVGAATCSVDVVTQRGAKVAGIRFRDLVNALVFPAFLIGGAAEKALLGPTDGSILEEARVSRRRAFRDAFAVLAVEVPGTDGELLSAEAANLSVERAVAWKRHLI